MPSKSGTARRRGGSRPQTAVFTPITATAIAGEQMRQWLRANSRCDVGEARRAAGKIAVWIVGKDDAPMLMPGLEEQIDNYFAALDRIYGAAGRPVVPSRRG